MSVKMAHILYISKWPIKLQYGMDYGCEKGNSLQLIIVKGNDCIIV